MSTKNKENLMENAQWKKVSELRLGMEIAVCDPEVSDSVVWDEIVSIKSVGREQVYDIEVEGTHNFVAGHLLEKETGRKLAEKEEQEVLAANIRADCKVNLPAHLEFGGIVAHNTYISGNVGIGTSTPSAKIHIVQTAAADAFRVDDVLSDTTPFVIGADGNVGIGTYTPLFKLDVAKTSTTGTTYVANFVNDGDTAPYHGLRVQAGADSGAGTTYYLDAYDGDGGSVGYLANVAGAFGVTDVSDISTKTNIGNTDLKGLDIINGLRVVDFNRSQNPDGPTLHGFIAQEVQAVFPEMVSEGPDGLLGLQKDLLIPVLVKAMQEQQNQLSVIDNNMQLVQSELGFGASDTTSRLANLELGIGNQELGMENFEMRIGNLESRIAGLESGIGNQESGTENNESGIMNLESGNTTETVPGQTIASDTAPAREEVNLESLQDTLTTLVESLDNLGTVSEQLNNISNSILTVMAANQVNAGRIDALEADTQTLKQIVKVVEEKVVIGTPEQYLVVDAATGLEIKSENFSLDAEGNLTLGGELNLKAGKVNSETGILELNPGTRGQRDKGEEGQGAEQESISARGRVVVAGDLEVQGKMILGAASQKEGEETAPDPTTGTGKIAAGETSVVIPNNRITENSLIYITPTSKTFGQVLYLESQRSQEEKNPDNPEETWPQGFTVSIENAAAEDVEFNWWVVEQK